MFVICQSFYLLKNKAIIIYKAGIYCTGWNMNFLENPERKKSRKKLCGLLCECDSYVYRTVASGWVENLI